MENQILLIVYLSSVLLCAICGAILLYQDYYDEKLTTYKSILIALLFSSIPIINTFVSIGVILALITDFLRNNIKIDINKKIFK